MRCTSPWADGPSAVEDAGSQAANQNRPFHGLEPPTIAFYVYRTDAVRQVRGPISVPASPLVDARKANGLSRSLGINQRRDDRSRTRRSKAKATTALSREIAEDDPPSSSAIDRETFCPSRGIPMEVATPISGVGPNEDRGGLRPKIGKRT